mmetsp:Transcript_2351/g.4056  ORF Transcript_2351/g.4056 Transcript_2351/m.4056 type:complete len:100 (+) Transcript_2351:385-684(+)
MVISVAQESANRTEEGTRQMYEEGMEAWANARRRQKWCVNEGENCQRQKAGLRKRFAWYIWRAERVESGTMLWSRLERDRLESERRTLRVMLLHFPLSR